MLYIHQHWFKKIDNPDHSESLEYECNSFVESIQAKISEGQLSSENAGLYLATSNAGIMPSAGFWKSAVEKGPGFVFPRNFPWTLANSPCGYFAKSLGIKGPNFTLVGYANAMLAAIHHAKMDLENNQVDQCLVLGMDFYTPENDHTSFAGILLQKEASTLVLNSINPIDKMDHQADIKKLNPSILLGQIVESIEQKKDMIIGTVNEGFYQLAVGSNI